jgi:hypothetical protein
VSGRSSGDRVWTQQGGKLVGTGGVVTPEQGWSVALSADGNTAIVGGYYDNDGTGAAWVFVQPSLQVTPAGPAEDCRVVADHENCCEGFSTS